MGGEFYNFFFTVITIITLAVVAVVGLLFNSKTSQIAAKLEMIESAIKVQDAKLSIQFHQPSYYENKCSYEKLAAKLIGISCLANLGSKKLEEVSRKCIEEVNNYYRSAMLNGVKDAALKMKQYNHNLRTNRIKQDAMTAVKLINEDSNVIRSIGINYLERIGDKVEFNSQFNRIIDSLNTLKIMKTTEIVTTFKIRIQKVQRDFQTEYKELKENNFQIFKDRHIDLLSQLILSIQQELQSIQNAQNQTIKKESEQIPFGEYYLNFRIQITDFFKRMASDVDSNFASCSSDQSNSQCNLNGSNDNTANESKPRQSIFEKLKKGAEKVESRVREKTNRVKDSLYPNIDDQLAEKSYEGNSEQGYVPDDSQFMGQQQYYPSAPQPPFNPYLNQHQTYSQYPNSGQTYPFNPNYPTNIDHVQPPPPYDAANYQRPNY